MSTTSKLNFYPDAGFFLSEQKCLCCFQFRKLQMFYCCFINDKKTLYQICNFRPISLLRTIFKDLYHLKVIIAQSWKKFWSLVSFFANFVKTTSLINLTKMIPMYFFSISVIKKTNKVFLLGMIFIEKNRTDQKT